MGYISIAETVAPADWHIEMMEIFAPPAIRLLVGFVQNFRSHSPLPASVSVTLSSLLIR
jgi:hypothetical protein